MRWLWILPVAIRAIFELYVTSAAGRFTLKRRSQVAVVLVSLVVIAARCASTSTVVAPVAPEMPVAETAAVGEPPIPAQAQVLPRAVPCAPRRDLPEKSYWNQPEATFSTSDNVAHFRHMEAFYDFPGELGYIAEGVRYGFESLSFVITETQPSGGPPLHVHDSEEAHVLLEGDVEYVIGDRRFTAKGPYVARVPAGIPHTFINRGPCAFNLVAVFPSKKIDYKEVGPNPLVKPATTP